MQILKICCIFEKTLKNIIMLNLRKLFDSSIERTAQEKMGRNLTAEERDELKTILSEIGDDSDIYDETEEYRYDAETLAIMREEQIEQIGADIRMIVVGYVEIKNNPFPYVVKKHLPFMKESLARILATDSDLLADAVRYAEKDMFEGDFRLLDNVEMYRSFFDQYTAGPAAFRLESIKSVIPVEYSSEIEALF